MTDDGKWGALYHQNTSPRDTRFPRVLLWVNKSWATTIPYVSGGAVGPSLKMESNPGNTKEGFFGHTIQTRLCSTFVTSSENKEFQKRAASESVATQSHRKRIDGFKTKGG